MNFFLNDKNLYGKTSNSRKKLWNSSKKLKTQAKNSGSGRHSPLSSAQVMLKKCLIYDISGPTNGDFVRFSDRHDLLWRFPQRLRSGWIHHRLCLCSRNVRCSKHWEWHQEHTKIEYKTKWKYSCITYTIHFLIKVSVSLLDQPASILTGSPAWVWI